MQKLKVLELFGGIGACSTALKRLKINYEIVDYVEIDKYAVKSFNAIHNTNFEPQDIQKWDKDIKVDLIMHGSPCQDFSLAGKNAGGDEGSGTRSSLMYETIRIVNKLKPKYVVWENVKNLLSKKHRHNFDNYLKTMEELGYENYYQILDAKDYGIPQHRERVFTISIHHSCKKDFQFPSKIQLELKLKDLLDDEVEEKYYLSEKMMNYVLDNNDSQKGTKWEGRADNDILNASVAHTLSVRGASGSQRAGVSNFVIDNTEEEIKVKDLKLKIKNATKQGYLEATDGDGVYISNIDKKRGTVQKEMIPTLKTSPDIGVVVHRNLKQTLCNKLIQENKVQEMDVIKHSYSTSRINDWNTRNVEHNNLSPTLDTRCDCLGVTVKTIGNYSPSGHNASRIVDNNGIAPTVMENHGTVTATQDECLRIRKLTPKECYRLMGFNDEEFKKAERVNSNAQLYKQAGNSIVVNVLVEIFRNLFKKEVIIMEKKEEMKTITYETNLMIDLEKLSKEEPELFNDLVKDYPVEINTKIIIEVK